MIVIWDTSVLIAYLLSKGKNEMQEIVVLAKKKKITLALSTDTLSELREKISSEKVKNYSTYNALKIGRFIAWYSHNSFKVNPKSKFKKELRDMKDDIFLLLAFETNADYLISVDKDLLVLKQIFKTKIVTPREFIKTYYLELSSPGRR